MSWRPATNPSRWLDWLPSKFRRPVRRLLVLLLVAGAATLAVVIIYGGLALRFDLDKVVAMPVRTTILDRDGKQLDADYGVKRRIISHDQLPQFLIEALLAREDVRFFDHGGIDLRGLARATARNIKDRSFTQGASTLTMQLARNTFDMRAKSLHRKLLEIALTIRIERRFKKDDILAQYLNRIYFGAGCYGVEEAAQTYFGKPTAALHPGECAMLVGIIRGPHVFSPFRDFDAALAQRDQVLDRMVAAGFIGPARAEEIRKIEIIPLPNEQRRSERSYALLNVRTELDLLLSRNDIGEGGLKVDTTLGMSWQVKLESTIGDSIAKLEGRPDWPHPTHAGHQAGKEPEYLQVAAVSLETRTGAILALVGGRDFLDSRFDRSSGARRDLGSAFEPFVAAAASERAKLVLPGKPVQTGRQVGPAEVERIARRCGITGPFQNNEDLFRGAAAASPLELAIALATIGNDGQRPRPFLINAIQDRGGRTLYQAAPNLSPALSADTAHEVIGLFRKKESTHVFTGSSPAGRDGWILRLGPTGATAIWLGFDNPKEILPRDDLDAFLADLAGQLANL